MAGLGQSSPAIFFRVMGARIYPQVERQIIANSAVTADNVLAQVTFGGPVLG
jgi:hypothetical protein